MYLKNYVGFILFLLTVGCVPPAKYSTREVEKKPYISIRQYRIGRMIMRDVRPDSEKVIHWFYRQILRTDKFTVISGGVFPDKGDILEFGKRLKKIMDSVMPSSSPVEVDILHYYVRVLPDEELHKVETALFFIGMGGISLFVWNGVRLAQEIMREEDPLTQIGGCIMYPILIFQPRDAISTTADILLAIFSIGFAIYEATPRKVEGIIEIRIKTAGREDTLRGEYLEEVVLGKYFVLQKISSRISRWRVKEEYLKEIMEAAEEDLFEKLRRRRF